MYDDLWKFMILYDDLMIIDGHLWIAEPWLLRTKELLHHIDFCWSAIYIYIYPVVYPHEWQAYASKISQKHHDYMSNHDDIPWISFFEYPMYRNSPTAIMVISCHILWNSHESPSKSGELERHKSCSRVWKLKISCESWRPKRTSILDFQGTWHRGKNRGFMGYSWEMRGTFILDYEISGINGIW